MARYERIEGGAERFWEIEVDGRFVITRWGRLGRHPQSRTIACADEATAQHRRDSLVRQKTSKGYERVGEELDAPRTGAGNPELEAALAADPDDLDTRLVYADWLMAQDATLGELIALEVAHARTGDESLLSRIAKLQKQCAGEVGDRRSVRLRWRHGLIRRAQLGVMGSGTALLRQLLALPAARTLSVLRLDTEVAQSSREERVALLRTLGELAPPHLTTLELRHRASDADPDFGDAGRWWANLPAFERLFVASPTAALPLPTKRLRVFGFDAQHALWHPSLREPWPELEHLVLDRMPTDAVVDVLTSLVAPRLTTVALHHLDLESIPWRHLLNARIGATLRTIELVGEVPWALRGALERFGDRVTVRWCSGPAPEAERRPDPAVWLEVAPLPRYSVPW